MPTLSFFLVLALTTTAWLQPPLQVTFPRLLRETVDLDGLIRFPEPPFVFRQFSSRDRLSDDPKNKATWFANQDRGNCLYDGTVSTDTPFFKENPGTSRKSDGIFLKGTRIGLARHRTQGEYVWAYATAADGGLIEGKIPQGYIPQSALRPNPEGHVLAEMDGPGCLVRFWAVNPSEAGMVRIYLDHASTPIISARLQDLLGGTWEKEIDGQRLTPFPKPLAGERGQGWTLLFPLPYQQHCKVVVDKPEFGYQIQYRTYPVSTKIETFSWELWLKHRADLALLADYLAHKPDVRRSLFTDPTSAETPLPRNLTPVREVELAAGKEVVLRTFIGAGCIDWLEIKLNTNQPVETLRGLLFTATFDDAPSPQICCPLGDFFGTSPGANPFQAEPLSVSADLTLVSHWKMPFARKAVFTLVNRSRFQAYVGCEVAVRGIDWNERLMHFHAKWKLHPTLSTRPWQDWNVCHLHGRGVYVGTMLSVTNPVTAWWGDGNDKTYVDGEPFPSLFGTGTDDYFGYALGHRQRFSHPLHNLTRCDGPGHFGHFSMNRFQLLDRIPFQKEFRFDLELRHWIPNLTMSYAVTCYWYAKEGSTDECATPTDALLQSIPQPPSLHRITDVLEGEQLKILGRSSEFPLGRQEMVSPEGNWSNGAQLYAQSQKKGEWVDLAVPVTKPGQYRLFLYLTQGTEYGHLRFHVNGKSLDKPFTGFRTGYTRPALPLDLGAFDLDAGTLKLRIETTGTEAAAVFPRYAWGLDAVKLQPIK